MISQQNGAGAAGRSPTSSSGAVDEWNARVRRRSASGADRHRHPGTGIGTGTGIRTGTGTQSTGGQRRQPVQPCSRRPRGPASRAAGDSDLKRRRCASSPTRRTTRSSIYARPRDYRMIEDAIRAARRRALAGADRGDHRRGDAQRQSAIRPAVVPAARHRALLELHRASQRRTRTTASAPLADVASIYPGFNYVFSAAARRSHPERAVGP